MSGAGGRRWMLPCIPVYPLRAMHMASVTVGPYADRVLMWDGDAHENPTGSQFWSLMDPEALDTDPEKYWNFALNIPNDPLDNRPRNLGCSGHARRPDGKLQISGGTSGVNPAVDGARVQYVFNPLLPLGNSMWLLRQEMQEKRWYPSGIYVTSQDGGVVFARMLVPGGSVGDDYEAFDIGTTNFYRWNNQGTPDRLFPGPSIDWPLKSRLNFYARLHLLGNGEMYRAGMTPHGVTIRHKDGDSAPRGTWVAKGDGLVSREYGASFLYPNLDASLTDAVVHLGGRTTISMNPPVYVYHNTVEICKASASAAGSFGANPQG